MRLGLALKYSCNAGTMNEIIKNIINDATMFCINISLVDFCPFLKKHLVVCHHHGNDTKKVELSSTV